MPIPPPLLVVQHRHSREQHTAHFPFFNHNAYTNFIIDTLVTSNRSREMVITAKFKEKTAMDLSDDLKLESSSFDI